MEDKAAQVNHEILKSPAGDLISLNPFFSTNTSLNTPFASDGEKKQIIFKINHLHPM